MQDIDDPDDIIDQRVTIKGYGKGTVVEYDEESQNEKKGRWGEHTVLIYQSLGMYITLNPELFGRWGEHTVEFDSGKVSRLQLDTSSGIQYKVLNERYVEDIVKVEVRIFQENHEVFDT